MRFASRQDAVENFLFRQFRRQSALLLRHISSKWFNIWKGVVFLALLLEGGAVEMKAMKLAMACGLLAGGLGASMGAWACSTAAWNGGTSGAAVAGSPTSIPRYSELCALEVTGTGHVQSNYAVDEARYRARFYVLDGVSGTGSADIFTVYSDDAASSPLFKVSFDGSQFTFDATDAGGNSASAAAKSGWNVVELDWTADGNLTFWVNADATTDAATGSASAGTGVVGAARLGAPAGLGGLTGKVVFDAFESHRETPIGLLIKGDANGNSSINIFDMISIQNEILDPVGKLAVGQPDCNENGSINIFDMICVQNIILSGG